MLIVLENIPHPRYGRKIFTIKYNIREYKRYIESEEKRDLYRILKVRRKV